MFDFLRFFLGGIVWLFVLGVALWRGEKPERIVAGGKLVSMFATPLVQGQQDTVYTDLAFMAVDVGIFALVLWVALRFNRWWAQFCAAFHLIMVGIHIIKSTRPETSQFVYVTAEVVFSYFTLWALAAGIVALEIRRFRETGRPLA